MAGVPRPVRRARAAVSVSFALQGFLLAVLLTELPQFTDRFHLSDAVVTGVVLAVSLLAGVGSVSAEKIAGRTSSRFALRLGVLVIAAAGLVIGLAPVVGVLYVGFAAYGLGLGMVDAGCNMQGVAIQHRYGRSVISSIHAVWSAGGIVGALWVAACERLDFPVGASVTVAAVLVLLVGAACGPYLLETGRERISSTTVSIPWRPILVLGLAMAFFYVIDFGVANWSALYLRDELTASSSTAALAYAAYQGCGLAARLSGDGWVRRFGARRTVRVGATIGSVGMAVAILAGGPALAIAGFAVVGIGMPVVAPLCFGAAGELVPEENLDVVIARLNIFNYAGTVMGGALVGALGSATSLRIGFVIPLVFGVALIALAPAFGGGRRRTRGPISDRDAVG